MVVYHMFDAINRKNNVLSASLKKTRRPASRTDIGLLLVITAFYQLHRSNNIIAPSRL